MSLPSDPQRSPTRSEGWMRCWKEVVVPTATSLEAFAWKVAWFALLVKLMFFSR